jgi:hypothetical protein
MVSSSPGLIAAAHVLHRLLAPRHPPCALLLLIMKNTCFCHYGVFKVRASSSARRHRPEDGLSKLNSVTFTELDIVLGTRTSDGLHQSLAIERAEYLPE